MEKILKNTLLVLFCKLFIVNARYHRAVNVDNHVMPQDNGKQKSYPYWKPETGIASRTIKSSHYSQGNPYYDDNYLPQRDQQYRYTDYEYVYDDVKPRKNVVPFKSIVDNVASFVSKGFRNFAKELKSKQDAQELFSSSVVALPLVAFASFLLLREPLVEFLEDKLETTTTEASTVFLFSSPSNDPCDSLECSGLGSNLCVNGRCVCGSSSTSCPVTSPVCYGEGLSATCVCYPGSCNEPNPVCDPADGTCKCNIGATKSTCAEGSADSCSSTDGTGICMCGVNSECTGATPKCDTSALSSTCVACDDNFCSQPLPWCVPTGLPGAGSCQCGNSADCGTTDQTGNTCSENDATGVCMCGETAPCFSGSTVEFCLNNAIPPIFEPGDQSSTCKCSGTSCSTAMVGVIPSYGACSSSPDMDGLYNFSDFTLGMCISCNVDGAPGDGSSQGSCPTGLNCHADGSCSFCSSTAGGLAGTDAEPHSGCTSLNPRCNADGTECQCDTTTQLICDSTVSTICAMADTTGVCMCGGDPACSGMTPTCDMMSDPATCVGCSDDAGMAGDGTIQGTCSSESTMCLMDGSCQCQLDMAGGGPGDAMSPGTCAEEGLLCLPDGTCKCQIDNAGGGDGDGTTQGTCMVGDACNADGSCSACNVGGNPGDGTTQGTCSEGYKCSAMGTCLCRKDDTDTPGDSMDAGTCIIEGQFCTLGGLCSCLTAADGTGVPGDGMGQGTCPNADQLCRTDGTCGCLTASDGSGVQGDNTIQGSCPDAGTICRSDGSCGCLTTNDGSGVQGDNTIQGSCPDAGTICRSDGSCGCLTTNDGTGVPGDGTTQGTCDADFCLADGTCGVPP